MDLLCSCRRLSVAHEQFEFVQVFDDLRYVASIVLADEHDAVFQLLVCNAEFEAQRRVVLAVSERRLVVHFYGGEERRVSVYVLHHK